MVMLKYDQYDVIDADGSPIKDCPSPKPPLSSKPHSSKTFLVEILVSFKEIKFLKFCFLSSKSHFNTNLLDYSFSFFSVTFRAIISLTISWAPEETQNFQFLIKTSTEQQWRLHVLPGRYWGCRYPSTWDKWCIELLGWGLHIYSYISAKGLSLYFS